MTWTFGMRDPSDDELTRLLQAVRADADPVLWTRVRARIASRRRAPALVRWAMRPAALAASFALLAISVALVMTYEGSTASSSADDYATIGDALIAERDAEATAAPAPAKPGGAAARDSGGGR